MALVYRLARSEIVSHERNEKTFRFSGINNSSKDRIVCSLKEIRQFLQFHILDDSIERKKRNVENRQIHF
ncbi:hypothetical protein PFISCL1PPCAC_2967, partial [Pristionchus fissidentatus]